MQSVLNIVGWLGSALVFGAVAVRFLRPEWDQYAVYGAEAGLVCVVLYTLGQWRDIVNFFKQRQARYGALATLSVVVAFGIVVAVNYLGARVSHWVIAQSGAHVDVLVVFGLSMLPSGRAASSAASTMRVAMRSFTDPPGLRYSTLASTSGASGPRWEVTERNRTSGVPPMSSTTLSTYCMRRP